MELLCENEGHLNTKGGSLRWEDKKFLVIVVSNYSIADCYHNASNKDPSLLDPLYVRFRSCRMTEDYQLMDQSDFSIVWVFNSKSLLHIYYYINLEETEPLGELSDLILGFRDMVSFRVSPFLVQDTETRIIILLGFRCPRCP